MRYVQLATLLHKADYIAPDGGSRISEAERAYRLAIRHAPNPAMEAGVTGNLGALLLGVAGRVEDGLRFIERCIERFAEARIVANPLYAGALFNRGKALDMLGRAGEAQDAYAEAARAARGISAAQGSYAKAFAAQKQLSKEQVAELEDATRYLGLVAGEVQEEESPEDEDDSAAGRRRRRWRTSSGDDAGDGGVGVGGGGGGGGAARAKPLSELQPAWEWLDGIGAEDRSWLHFALYHGYEAQGDASRAWHHLELANRLQRSRIQYSPDGADALLHTLRELFLLPASAGLGSAAHASELTSARATLKALLAGDAGCDDATPVFVVGMPRSGSTLVEQILASHSQVFGAGEDTAFQPLVPDLIAALNSADRKAAIAAVGMRYVAAMRAHMPRDSPNPSPARIVDKMLRNAWNVGHIAIALPRASVVHVVRHPLDVVLSCYVQPFEGRGTPWAWDLKEIAHEVALTHEVMKLWDEVLPGRVLHVRYEELVADQAAVSRRLLAHCGLPWEEGVLDFHATQRTVQTASLGQVRKRIYGSAVARWRQYAAELRPAAEILQPLIDVYEAGLRSAGLLGGHADHDEL
ncbi:hypothetical protein WJX81_002302 [Elliptochloris bilobata]|uniref:protein-tyrosine sulfotransferase n=1 Tax=Elliptochloris bilobata TaxID=381761 RepID=A0AAW1QKZ3_9CHLO